MLTNTQLPAAWQAEAKKIAEQASSHMTREGLARILNQIRPHESDTIKDYRVRNQRRLTTSPVNSWFAMVSRIFNNSGVQFTNISERLSDYLDTYPFVFADKELDLSTYLYEIVLRQSITDPNGYFVVIPMKADYEDTSEQVKPQMRFFHYNEFIGILDDAMYFAVTEDKNANLHTHYLVYKDRITVSKDTYSEGKIRQEHQFTYIHNIGQYPVIGTISNTIMLDAKLPINESLLQGAFEYWDEALSQFSDNQAVTVQHNFPIRIITSIPCPADGCNGGHVRDKDGNISKCGVCKGTGSIVDISPYHTLVAPDKNAMGEGISGRDPVMYVAPPESSIEASYIRAMDLLKKGKEEIGLDLIGSETESGVSRNMRLEEKQDKLLQVANKLKMFAEQMLYFYERMLNVLPAEDATFPLVVMPRTLHIKDSYTLMEEIKASPLADRYNSYMAYIEEKYSGDVMQMTIYRCAFAIAPALLLNDAEIEKRLVSGVYTNFDIYKADVAVMVLSEIYDGEMSEEELKKKADEQIRRTFSGESRVA